MRITLPTNEPAPIILRRTHLREIYGLADSTVDDAERHGTFPKRIRLTARTTGWLKSEVDAWVTARVDARNHMVKRAEERQAVMPSMAKIERRRIVNNA